MNFNNDELKALLIKTNYLDEKDIATAEKSGARHHDSLADVLIEQGLLTKDLLGQAIAEHAGLPYADLNTNVPQADQVARIPADIAEKYHAVLYDENEGQVVVATDNPSKRGIMPTLKKVFSKQKITLAYSLPDDITPLFSHYRKALSTRFAKIIKGSRRVAPEILEEILKDALSLRASDIHFEPQEEEVIIRFRIDGVMQEAGRMEKPYYENVVNRVKVWARLRTDEHFAAQDGAIRFEHGEEKVNMRISIAPVLDGEKIVIRILSEYVKGLTLSNLGLSERHEEILIRAGKKPFGLILVVGPTGSGKTTTLYSLLKMVNTPEVNISTIEDPVEYRIDGVNHIQVNRETDLTFAKGLRTIVRQDPDVILVGEIRDEETAEIGINAALTGILVFSTFHANDAATAMPRLLDMGVESFLLASTLEVVIGQRLVRRICDECRVSTEVEENIVGAQHAQARELLEKNSITRIYYGKGCAVCNDTGFVGRIAIFEFVEISPAIEELVMKQAGKQEIWKQALKEGTRPMFDDGLEKVRAGITTVDEVIRVIGIPDEQLKESKKAKKRDAKGRETNDKDKNEESA